MDWNFKPEDIINANERFLPIIKKKKPPLIDPEVKRATGLNIPVNDPKLINLIVKWKKQKNNDETMDNFLKDPKKIEELKKEFQV